MKKKIDTEKTISVKQLNPWFRLPLFVLCNWLEIPLFFLFLGGFNPYIFKITFIYNHYYIAWIFLACFIAIFLYLAWCGNCIGIKYVPRDVYDYYLEKNNGLLNNDKIQITDISNLFDVTPICKEVYPKKTKVTNNSFVKLSEIEKSTNRLVVNGRIDHCDFSWGVVSRVKIPNFKTFLLIILYFGPIRGISMWLLAPIVFNLIDCAFKKNNLWGILNPTKYQKLGCCDLVVKNIARPNSENYLIFAAKLQNSSKTMSFVPKSNNIVQNLDLENQYEWPSRISNQQKEELQDILKTLDFLPSIYVDQDNISIVMKKYHYSKEEDAQLQTWELLKQENLDGKLQFNYLDNAIKIYDIFNQKSDFSKKELNYEK